MKQLNQLRTRDLIRDQRPTAITLVSLSIGAAILGLAQPAVMGAFINDISEGQPYLLSLGLAVALLVLGAFISGISMYIGARFDQTGSFSLRQGLVAAIARTPIARLSQRSSGELSARIISDPPVLMTGASALLAQGVAACLTCVGATIAALVLIPRAFLLAMSCFAVALVLTVIFGVRARDRRLQVQEANSGLSDQVQATVDGMPLIRHYGVQVRFEQKVRERLELLRSRSMRLAATHAVVGPVMQLVMNAALVIALLTAATEVARGRVPLAALVAFIMYFQLATTGFQEVLSSHIALQEAQAGRTRLLELSPGTVTDLPANEDPLPPERSWREGDDAAKRALGSTSAVRFDNVEFSYGERSVLTHVTFDIPRGSVTAIVGPSGAGKTTVLNLIEGFLKPDSGTVTALRPHGRSTGLVDQGATVIAGTVADNVRFERDGVSDSAIADVLRKVGLPELSSDEGLRTPVMPRGASLSGGERQRLALARALVLEPQILVLDEPTAHVDGSLEQHMLDAVEQLAPEATVIVVAHRPSTVRRADRVLLVRGGSVLDQGAPAACLETNGELRELLGEGELSR